MVEPLVSVIVTTYNRFELLCSAIDSILTQTYSNIEIIVVDDCSTDATENKIENFIGQIKYVRNDKNIGLSASRNVGISVSSGTYISFLDDDDEILPQKVALQVELFNENKSADVVYCGAIRRYKDYFVYKYPSLTGSIYPEVLGGCPGTVHSLMIKKKCFDEVGLFDERLEQFEDFDLWVRISKKYKFDFVDECLVVYNYHPNQMTKKYKEILSSRDYLLDKYAGDYLLNKRFLCVQLRRQISLCALYSDYGLFYKYLFRAIKVFPFNVILYFHLLLAISSKKMHRKIIVHFGNKNLSPGMTSH